MIYIVQFLDLDDGWENAGLYFDLDEAKAVADTVFQGSRVTLEVWDETSNVRVNRLQKHNGKWFSLT